MSLRLEYDPEADAAYLRFSGSRIVESEEVSPGVVVDYDETGRMVAIEFAQASKRLPEDVFR